MIRLALIVLLLAAQTAAAEVARVTSGEHDGYSRLLVTTAAVPDGWRLTRTEDGYALGAGTGTTGFDLSRAFDRIPRTRITALFADPADGRLRIRVGCACHAIAFRHEGRYLVVDVRDGPAPARSAFELAEDGTRLPALAATGRTITQHVGDGYDWLSDWDRAAVPAGGTAPNALPRTIPSPEAAGAGLRAALMSGIARGAAAGVIGLRLPEGAPVAMPPGVTFFNGAAPGVALDTDPGDRGPVPAQSRDCPASARFDVSAWATAEPYVLQFARHRAALLGEFDRPDQTAVDAAIRFHLHLGFGTEAADLMRAFPGSASDAQVWSMMAAVLDGETPADPALRAWMACDTAAALWATLALPAGAAGDANRRALRQTFGTLPPHLRALLAPALRERALLLDDAGLAASVVAAADRGGAPAADTAPAALLAAWRDGGNDAVPAALAYVAAAHAAGLPVPAEVPGALLSLAEDYRDLPEGDRLSRAARLAAALAGDHETAFADPALAAEMPDLWAQLVASADDDRFIAIAVARRGAFPANRPDLAADIAGRLLALRLPELALDWLPDRPRDGPGAATAAAALVDLGRGREALAWLDGLPAAETAALRARAAELAGEHALAAAAWSAAGDPDRAARSARLAGRSVATAQDQAGQGSSAPDPQVPAGSGQDDAEPPSAWTRLARDATSATRAIAPGDAAGSTAERVAGSAGPLQSASALVAASAGLRADIDALLADTALPAEP
jgi:hypothetical protein